METRFLVHREVPFAIQEWLRCGSNIIGYVRMNQGENYSEPGNPWSGQILLHGGGGTRGRALGDTEHPKRTQAL